MEEARVVMIGAPFAGKSTLLAQMRCLYRQGFSQQQREEHAPIVHATTMARRGSAEHLIATKALCCTATAWIPHCR